MNVVLKSCWILMAATVSADEGRSVLLKSDDPHFCRMIFGDKQLTVRSAKVTFEATYSLGSQQSPKTIDVSRTIKGKPVTFRGIYELRGDRLRLCLAGPDDDRPTTFSHGNDIEIALELRRER